MARCASCDRHNREGARFCDACGSMLQPGPTGTVQRKTVTVLFCDVCGSTSMGDRLDPESLQTVMARYFDLARHAVERHEGTVEKFIGDAVMAVFGIPVAHEDDAVRAVRAALDLRAGLVSLNERLRRDFGVAIEVRMGVNTGRVVTGTIERLVTGDAVNVAARLEQAASPGEILLGPTTTALLRSGVRVEDAGHLNLKGKPDALRAHRLISLDAGQPARGRRGIMVGRHRELEGLRRALARTTTDRSCHLLTVLGAAGVGKSRLVEEFLSDLDGAMVGRGSCVAYGEGAMFAPLAEMLRQLLGDDPPERLAGLGLDEFAVRSIRTVFGEADAAATLDEISWATRELLEVIAGQTPLVLILDDIHWAQPALLDVIDHLAGVSQHAPILLVCTGRPELLDERSSWGNGMPNATTFVLEPLSDTDARALATELLREVPGADAIRERVLRSAEGNPLFVEELVELVRESPSAIDSMPPTIHALLAARLDCLDPVERAVLQFGSIEGSVFHAGLVHSLASGDGRVDTALTSLVRRDLLRPDRAHFDGHTAFRFRHVLVRDAAYDALAKRVRAGLHERAAGWIDGLGLASTELDEVVGHHLERSVRLRSELGPVDAVARSVADRAAERLAAAGARATLVGDARSSNDLLGRASALFERNDRRRLGILPDLGRALYDTGDLDRADLVLTECIELGTELGDRRATALAAAVRAEVWLETAAATRDETRRELARAELVLDELGDRAGLARVLAASAAMRFWAGDVSGAEAAMDRAVALADEHRGAPTSLANLQYLAQVEGPAPVGQALQRLERLRMRDGGNPQQEVTFLSAGALLEAMRGRFAVAEESVAQALALTARYGLNRADAVARWYSAKVELLAGRTDSAQRVLTPAIDSLQRMGDVGFLVSFAPVMADILLVQGRPDDAVPLIDVAGRHMVADDLDAQISYRRTRARLLAHHGEFDAAVRLAQQAVQLAEATEFLPAHAVALDDLATVYLLAGDLSSAARTLDDAIRCHEDKGNVSAAARSRARRAELS